MSAPLEGTLFQIIVSGERSQIGVGYESQVGTQEIPSFFLVGLGFELQATHLLSRCSIT
jgi:hypothetical protein